MSVEESVFTEGGKLSCMRSHTAHQALSEVTMIVFTSVNLVVLLPQEARQEYSIMLQGTILSPLKTQGTAITKEKITGLRQYPYLHWKINEDVCLISHLKVTKKPIIKCNLNCCYGCVLGKQNKTCSNPLVIDYKYAHENMEENVQETWITAING